MSSLAIREVRENIINYLNKISLPMEAKRLVVKEILGQLESASEQEIIAQIKARDSAKKVEEAQETQEEEEEGEADD